MRGLPVEHFDSVLAHADGVTLFWGETPDALVAQINKVEAKLASSQTPAPSVFAFMYCWGRRHAGKLRETIDLHHPLRGIYVLSRIEAV
jgi:hypothetical protein